MNSSSNLSLISTHTDTSKYPADSVSEELPISSFPNIPLSSALLIALCVMALTWIAYTALKFGGSIGFSLGKNTFHVQGNQSDLFNTKNTHNS